MRLLDRYLLRELLVPLGYCLSGFLVLWISFDLVAEFSSFQSRNLTAGDIAQYYLVKTPEFLVLVGPIGLLLALLYTLTNHSRHHELTAIRAAGVSLWRLCLPYLVVGFLGSLGLFALNELWVPETSERAEAIRHRHEPPQSGALGRDQVVGQGVENSAAGRWWYIGVYDVRTGEMHNPLVNWQQPDGSRLVLKAERAARVRGVWTFYGVQLQKEPAQPNAVPIPLLRTNVLARPEFLETPEQIKSEIKIGPMINSFSLRAAKKADVPVFDILNYLRLHPRPSRASLLFTKLHGRLAAPWVCLVVVLIAVPFGAASGRRNVFVGVASSVVLCFLYYFVQQLFLYLGTGNYVPPWLAGWFPNLAFGVTGLVLAARVR